jgi:exopolysaccharide biosynthesis polyprenyl glycosylphosphotransferase
MWRFLKPLLDAVLVFLSFTIAYWLRYDLQWFRQVEPAFFVPFRVYLPSVVSVSALLVLVYWLEGAYRHERGRPFLDEFYIVFRGTLIGIATMIVVVFLATPSYYSRLIFGYTGIVTLFVIGAARTVEGGVRAWRHRRGLGVNRVLIVGADEIARSIMRAIVARPELGYQVVGFVDDDPVKSQTDIGRYPALGDTNRLPELIVEHDVDEVMITLPWVSHRKIIHLMQQCERRAVRVRIVPDLFQMALSQVVVDHLDGIPLLGIREPALSEWQVVLKRVIDVLISALGLIMLSPVLLLVALALKLDSPGPIIFRQVRVGRGGREFVCFKFRSMCVDAEARLNELREKNESSGPLFKMRHDPRLTRMGRLLRRTSMDELPQLWNILRGEMSLIGPRPAIPAEVTQYEAWHRRRLEASPGLTGLWQVSGRSNLTFDEMVLLDIYYIENWSPVLDLQIMLKTIPTVILGAGAY